MIEIQPSFSTISTITGLTCGTTFCVIGGNSGVLIVKGKSLSPPLCTFSASSAILARQASYSSASDFLSLIILFINFDNLTNKPTIPSDVSDLNNDSGFITGINSTLVTNALGFTPLSTVSSTNITNAGGVLTSALNFGDPVFASGGTCSFTSTDNGSNFSSFNATGEISITHPTLGTFACNYTFTKNSSNQISSFTLTNTGTGNDAFTSSSFGSAAASKSITVTHTASSKTIVCFASVTVFNSGSGGGGPGGGSCFISGTKVGLPNKEEKEIQKVEIGDYVLTENEHDEVDGIAKVLNKGSIKVDSYYYINQELGLTAGHPIWVEDKGWACIDPGEYYKECKLLNHVIDLEPVELEIGDKTTNGKIEIINKIEEEQEVWWITVDNTHTYYVNGILVHNGAKP